MHHNSIAFVYENYKASEIGQEKEAKDASSIIIVKLYVVAIVTQLCCVIFLATAFGHWMMYCT
jgi:hypothetical protein